MMRSRPAPAHEHPLSIIISTQAPTDADLLSTLIDAAKASGDPTTKLFLWAASPEDDPWSRKPGTKPIRGLPTGCRIWTSYAGRRSRRNGCRRSRRAFGTFT